MTSTVTPEQAKLILLIQERMHRGQVKLSSGSYADIYLDMKHVLDTGERIHIALDALATKLFDILGKEEFCAVSAIGGPTMGADVIALPFASNVATLKWFSIREPKTSHGLGKTIEGGELGPGDSVILTDDVVHTGSSLLKAYGQVTVTGARVAAVVPLVDRSGLLARPLANIGVPYYPVLTYENLSIPSLVA